MYLKNKIIFIFIFLFSCQPLEILNPVDIDISKLEKISINVNKIEIISNYNPIFSEENIEDQIQNSPFDIIFKWNENNIIKLGNENKLVINILDSSILKKEIDNANAKRYEEKTIFQYKINLFVEYQLYDDNNFLVANTTVESTRTTTSQKYISLSETEVIINDLLINAINDFILEAKNQLSIYMIGYYII